ncbi:MAG: hypothetical protein IPN29_13085 [Saprospiraceae bacterium]|nr:hypothetical protein [Saprospiraceae bacterium]
MKNPFNFYNLWLILLIALLAIGWTLDGQSQTLDNSPYEKATAMIRQSVRLVASRKVDSE